MPPSPERPLFLLDYDGTLAPIVADPAQAVPHTSVPGLLARLAARHPVALLTGRDLAAVSRLLVDAENRTVPLRAVGLHGAEWGTLGQTPDDAVDDHADALVALRAAVPTGPGIVIEDKGRAFAVHYRLAPDPATAKARLDAWAATAPATLEPVAGKFVVELRARGTSKGTAALRLAAEHPTCTPVMIGDDVTDEDAFRALNDVWPDAVTIRVGPGETGARHRLEDVDAVVAYLATFPT